jgi:hypothetical protein
VQGVSLHRRQFNVGKTAEAEPPEKKPNFARRAWANSDFVGGHAQRGRAKEKMHDAKKSLMISYGERENLMRQGLSDRADAKKKTRFGSTALASAVGASQGLAAGATTAQVAHALSGRSVGTGARLGAAALGAAAGAATTGVGANVLSRIQERNARERSEDPTAVRASILRSIASRHRLKQEAGAISDLVAAREGRKSTGRGMFSANINLKKNDNEPRREPGTGER